VADGLVAGLLSFLAGFSSAFVSVWLSSAAKQTGTLSPAISAIITNHVQLEYFSITRIYLSCYMSGYNPLPEPEIVRKYRTLRFIAR
jgi:hypothetical protein